MSAVSGFVRWDDIVASDECVVMKQVRASKRAEEEGRSMIDVLVYSPLEERAEQERVYRACHGDDHGVFPSSDEEKACQGSHEQDESNEHDIHSDEERGS